MISRWCRAVFIFNLTINGLNLLGITSTIAGGAYYSYVEYTNKQEQQKGQHPAMLSVRPGDEATEPLLPVFSPGMQSPTAIMSEKALLSPLLDTGRPGQLEAGSRSNVQETDMPLVNKGAVTGLGLL